MRISSINEEIIQAFMRRYGSPYSSVSVSNSQHGDEEAMAEAWSDDGSSTPTIKGPSVQVAQERLLAWLNDETSILEDWAKQHGFVYKSAP
jgi:hypothetical protein